MNWDFPEVNPFAGAAGDFGGTTQSLSKSLATLPSNIQASVQQQEASSGFGLGQNIVIATDPPYYDNIGYADLSDFFYVWLRRSLNAVYPEIFSTLLVPKAQELVATPYRFGGNKD
jgi:putative DNA methylase